MFCVYGTSFTLVGETHLAQVNQRVEGRLGWTLEGLGHQEEDEDTGDDADDTAQDRRDDKADRSDEKADGYLQDVNLSFQRHEIDEIAYY